MSDQGSPARVPDGQPDPVLVGPGLRALKDEAYKDATYATPSLPTDNKHQMDSDAPSYFASIPGLNTEALDPSDTAPPPGRRKMSSGQDLLRRLSLTGDVSPMSPELDPRALHPGLKLSGRLISAAFCIPYKLYHQAGSDWVCDDQYNNFPKAFWRMTTLILSYFSTGAQATIRNFSPIRFIRSSSF
jgi:trehalose 6-phosphate synthase/phosphatase